jgi:hypothetical protein
VVHAAVSARQVSAPNWQRGGSTLLSQTSVQQPRPGPELQVSPVGRQSRFARSIWHWPPRQMFEQHSASPAQASLSILHSPPPHSPLKQPSEQQSSALAQATPSAAHAFVHCRTPAMPVTGSQRPVQQSALAAHDAPPPLHGPALAGAASARWPVPASLR